MKKLMYLVFVVLLSGLILISCSKDDDDNKSSEIIVFNGELQKVSVEAEYYSVEKMLNIWFYKGGSVLEQAALSFMFDVDLENIQIGKEYTLKELGESASSLLYLEIEDNGEVKQMWKLKSSMKIKFDNCDLGKRKITMSFSNMLFEKTFNGTKEAKLDDFECTFKYQEIKD